MKVLTCIDLFCGCGGFSLGLERAGFAVLAAIDSNEEAVKVFRCNFPNVTRVLHKDLTQFPPQKLADIIQANEVDVVVGGPPCQGFSTVRRRDGTNNGPRLVEDKRRFLYQEFLEYVQFFRPTVFVMENVLGLRSADGGKYFTRVQHEARAKGYRVHSQLEKASSLGVPQTRQRQLIIGTRLDCPDYFPSALQPPPRAVKSPTLGEAICDLPPVQAGGGQEETDYDMNRRRAHVAKYGRRYLYKTLEVHRAARLTAHRARPHSERDLRDFAKLREGEHFTAATKRGETFEFPYDRENFRDRYKRQHRNDVCTTILAHLSKDGLMFIHPTQNRSLTPREAARVQSFPDWFTFPVSRMHQFRMIGNAVPPLVAEAVGLAVKSYIEKTLRKTTRFRFGLRPLPENQHQAIEWLLALVRAAESNSLRRLPTDEFLLGWYSVAFLYGGLHPDSAADHGSTVSYDAEHASEISEAEPRLTAPYYVQSGWPVMLAPVAREAWRRYAAGELKSDEYYCSDAAIAGMCYRNRELALKVRKGREEVMI
jgi:DNA (cytosine-5)-methyltransferase 1